TPRRRSPAPALTGSCSTPSIRRATRSACSDNCSEAIEEIERVAAIEGVDGIFIGPADLAASLGHAGEPGHPKVVEAVESAIRRIRKAGKPAGILTPDTAFA